ncbi:hypothetical protein TREES_T100019055 [Tupaia chinensis]|uniref:Uncharacterized protein n=1 Tax=Tupaia chinensis TaxID=246437 RepID=L8Y1A9_TUPCH|nr:hypothetical protein TREES_T100019055 [Tupaia chinensis]
MLRLLRRATACFQRRVDYAQEQCPQHMGSLQGDTKLKTVQGVVTSFCSDHGLINESIHVKSGVMTGNTPLKVGQKVTATVEEDEISHGLKAIKVDTTSGYMPSKGDWLEVEYSIPPGTSNIRAHSVKPVSSGQMKEVSIVSLTGRNGVTDETIFSPWIL